MIVRTRREKELMSSTKNRKMLPGIYCLLLGTFFLPFVSSQSTNITACGPISFTSVSGTVQSPNYPGQYPTDITCFYNITVPGASSISIVWGSIVEFESDACDYDYLNVTLSNGTELKKVCDFNITREDFTVEDDSLFLRFVSDGSATANGFSLTYTANMLTTGALTTDAPTTTTPPSIGPSSAPSTYRPSNGASSTSAQFPDFTSTDSKRPSASFTTGALITDVPTTNVPSNRATSTSTHFPDISSKQPPAAFTTGALITDGPTTNVPSSGVTSTSTHFPDVSSTNSKQPPAAFTTDTSDRAGCFECNKDQTCEAEQNRGVNAQCMTLSKSGQNICWIQYTGKHLSRGCDTKFNTSSKGLCSEKSLGCINNKESCECCCIGKYCNKMALAEIKQKCHSSSGPEKKFSTILRLCTGILTMVFSSKYI